MTSRASSDVTGLLLQWGEGGKEARDRLLALLYRDLRGIARRSLRKERPDHTLQPTALVHEAYERLVDQARVQWRDRAHFFAVAAGLMRRILVDHARRRRALRRGGSARPVALEEVESGTPGGQPVDLLDLEEALLELAALDPDQARVVELRFFGGLSAEETAEALQVSRSTVLRDWALARAWLHRRLTAG